MTTRTTEEANLLEAVRHPLRAAMLKILTDREASPAEMSRALDEPDVSKVSFHARRLVELQCAELAYTRPGKRSSIEHVYRGISRHLFDLEQWQRVVDGHPELADHLVGEYMQAIVDDFATGARLRIGQDEHWHITRTSALLGFEELQEAVALFERVRLEIADLEDRALARGARTVPVSSSLALFRLADY